MFCVIQKVKNKTPDPHGTHKELIVTSMTFTIDGVTKTKYGYRYSDERFERPNTDAYKISIHHSYREDGKVKKKQWVICTMSYYDLLQYWPGDCVNQNKLNTKLEEMGITEEELWDLVYAKLDPITEQIKKEFKVTEEYHAKMEQKRVISKYSENKKMFDELFGDGAYDSCYDIFGTLMDKERLLELKAQRKANEEYRKRSYHNSYESNYNFNSGTSSNLSVYTDAEKVLLKKIYREAAKKFHPDVAKDDGSTMKLLTKLKEQWGV